MSGKRAKFLRRLTLRRGFRGYTHMTHGTNYLTEYKNMLRNLKRFWTRHKRIGGIL